MDGEPPQEEDFSQIPLVERSQHKNWKARLSAYNDVISKSGKTASDTDPFFRPYLSDGQLLRKWCLDANVVAQEKGIEAVLALVQNSGESSAKLRPEIVPALVDKALGATRSGTKKKGSELCGMFVEVENSGEGVMSDVLVGLDSKQPKVVAGTVTCLKELVESFGVTAMGNVKPLLKVISKIFAHTDKNVRAEGTSLVITLYTFLGAALVPSLSDLKPVQMSELQKSFDSLDGDGKGAGTGKPTRYTRKAQREREEAEANGEDADDAGEEEAAPAIDPRSLLDPVDALSLFPSDLDTRLSSTKWKDRLEALEECNKVLTEPRNSAISDRNVDAYGSLASTLGTKCKSDANVNVVMEAAKVLEGLARGLGRPFGRFLGVTMMACLERLKERKANVVEALGKALDAIFETVTLPDIVEEVLVCAKSKNPQVREGTLKFLHRSLLSTSTAPGKDQVKPMAETLVSLLGDSVEPVRTNAAECLGTMMKILGERAFNPYIEGVAEIQMAKVKDAFARAEIKYKAGGGKPAPKPTSSAPKAPPVGVKKAPTARAPVSATPSSPPIKSSAGYDLDALEDFSSQPVKAPPARFAKPGAAKPAAAPAPIKRPAPTPAAAPPVAAKAPPPAKAGAAKTLAVSPTEPVKYKYNPEDAVAQAAEIIPAAYQTQLADGAWKVRLEAAEAMVKWYEDGAAETVDAEIMMRFLSKTPGWGEKNFQVSAKLYQVMSLMAERSPTFGRPAASIAIGHLSDKLGDMKLKKPAGDALTAFAEKTSLAFVLAQAYESLKKQKAPKAQADAFVWIKQVLTEFGIAGIALRDLIAFVKGGLQSPNALARSSATQVLVTIRLFVGGDIGGFLEDLNPQLLTTINSEFDKIAGQAPPEPTRTSADLRDAVPAAGKAGKASGGGDPLDDLIPRVDLDKLVNSTPVIASSKDAAWKVRKEGFEALNAVLEVKSNSRLKPNMGEIGNVLKKAMADTNLACKMLALGIISKIAMGMGQPFDKHSRMVVAAVASVCADQKATTRTAALSTLSAIADACGSLDSLYPGLGTALDSANPALRASVLAWLAERLQAEEPTSGADLTALAGPIVSCLEDRNGDVRKSAGLILPFVVKFAGYDYVMDQTSKLKPASKATIVPLINNARGSGPSAPSAAPTSAPASRASAATPGPARVKTGAVPASRPASAASPRPGVPARTIAAPGRSLAMKALSSAPRPASSLSNGDDRPTALPRAKAMAPRPPSAISHTASASASSSGGAGRTPPFVTATNEARSGRVKKDGARWILDTASRAELAEYLASQMEFHASPETFALLFSKDHRAEEDFMVGLSTITDFYDRTAASIFGLNDDELTSLQMANVDLALKYAAIRLLSNNTQMAIRCLEVITNIVETMQGLNERFSDAEAKLFVPALIIKLGDNKFATRLAPIFESLDKVIAGSQVVQLLVQYGIEDKSAGKTCKNEALALIEKAYRKRGSILRKDDRGFFEALSRCVSDSGTRNAALSVMALLQLQGASKNLDAVIDAMPQGSKDMLANRRATMAAAKTSGVPQPALARASADSLADAAGSPLRRKPSTAPSSVVSRLAESSIPSSPASQPVPRSLASPSRLPKSSTGPSAMAPQRSIPGPSSRSIGLPLPSTSRLQRPADVFDHSNGQPQPKPASRNLATRPLSNGHSSSADPIMAIISDITHDDPSRSVEALKQIQYMLDSDPEAFNSNVHTLADTLMDEMDRAFTPPETLLDARYFRLVKHLIQAFSGFSSNQELMRRLKYDDIYTMLSGLSLHLIQADRMGGNIKEFVQFINMIVIQILATPDRLLVFKAMFRLIYNLTKDFSTNQTQPNEEIAAHADLVMRCLWKRCKVLDDDLRSGRLQPGPLLGVLEEFMRGVPPTEYRKRSAQGIALGDMPLRTVKTILQRIVVYAKEAEIEVYDVLLGEFGEGASDAIVYTYLFRLVGPDAAMPSTNRPLSPLLPTAAPRSAGVDNEQLDTGSPAIDDPVPAKEDTEAIRLVQNLRTGNQSHQLDALYAFMKGDRDREEQVQSAISTQLGPTVAVYIRRALEQRKTADNPSPARREATISPSKSPRPESLPVPTRAPRRSMAAHRPSSVAVDKSAPIDAQLAQYKDIFNRTGRLSDQTADSGSNGTSSAGGLIGRGVGGSEPLSEITGLQELNKRTHVGPRASDVD